MREQVITPRAGRSASAGSRGRSNGVAQRPARRERGGSGNARSRGGLRKFLSYAPLIIKVLLAVAAGILIFAGYRAAASASFFQAHSLDVSGVARVSAEDVRAIVRRNVVQTGVWRADLNMLSAELERLPWVRQAVVSRVLPDGLRVRVIERVPRAVVRTSGGKFIWVDDDAVSLGAMSTTDQMPDFFIRGWDESGTNEGRAENRLRMQSYLALARDWSAAGLVHRISEINLGDLHDLRVQLAGDDSQIEVRLGEKDFTNRLRRALKVLDEERRTARGPFITYVMALDTRTVIGTSAGAPSATEVASEDSTSGATNTATTNERETSVAPAASRKKESTDKPANRKSERQADKREADKERDKKRKSKDNAKDDAKSETRPRRVG
ncbi:MAG TPA: FtsQ-type POTRA domain-containing protein [Pyrinomonadaceae bacterium]